MSKHPVHPGYTECLCVLQGVCPGLRKELEEARKDLEAAKSSWHEWEATAVMHRTEAKRLREALEQIKTNTRPDRPWKGQDIADEVHRSILAYENIEDGNQSPHPTHGARSNMTFQRYRRINVAEMRPYVPGEDMTNISVSDPDLAAFEAFDVRDGMIARNPDNHADQWYVAQAYFEANFEPTEPEA